jgi:hypothetical protein
LYPRLLPETADPARALYRLAAAHAIAAHRGPDTPVDLIIQERWPEDRKTALFARTATAPATTSGSGWADAFAITAVGGFIASLRDSAAAALINRAPRVDLTGAGSILLPRASATGSSAWVVEGGAIPVGVGTLANATISPRKLALIQSLTRESLEHSPERWMEIVLKDSATAALDTQLFSNVAGDSTKPGGIAAGITALTASTATVGETACIADFRALTDAIAAVAGGEVWYFCSPGRAVAAKAYLPALSAQIYGSAFIPSTALYAVAVDAFVSAFDAVPSIVASISASAHYEDTSPLELTTGTQGSAVVATPVRGSFQMDLVLLRMTLKCGWGLRIPASASWIATGMGW